MAHVLWKRVHNGPLLSSKATDFGTNRKGAYDFLLDLNSNLGPILPRFRDIKAFVRQKPLFRYRSPISAKILECSLWSSSVMLGSAESKHPTLTNREIIFEDFQPMWSGYLNIMDRWTTCRSNTALCVASGGKKNCIKWQFSAFSLTKTV